MTTTNTNGDKHDTQDNNDNNKNNNGDDDDGNDRQDQGSGRRGVGLEAQTHLEPQVRSFSLFFTNTN